MVVLMGVIKGVPDMLPVVFVRYVTGEGCGLRFS